MTHSIPTPPTAPQQTFTPPMPAGGNTQNMTSDEAQQAFLSKLLLMLGIFTLGVLVFC